MQKLFFLVILPLGWFVVAIVSFQRCADKVYALAVAPSAWVFFFVSSHSVPEHLLKFAGLPAMIVVGFVLSKLKITPVMTIISSLVITFFLWLALVMALSQSTAITVPGASYVWFLCCFNLSLCLLPLFALPRYLFIWIRKAVKSKTHRSNETPNNAAARDLTSLGP
jgi:uncharacterized membrane protein